MQCVHEKFKKDVTLKGTHTKHTHTHKLPLALCSMFFQLSQAKEVFYSLSQRK